MNTFGKGSMQMYFWCCDGAVYPGYRRIQCPRQSCDMYGRVEWV